MAGHSVQQAPHRFDTALKQRHSVTRSPEKSLTAIIRIDIVTIQLGLPLRKVYLAYYPL